MTRAGFWCSATLLGLVPACGDSRGDESDVGRSSTSDSGPSSDAAAGPHAGHGGSTFPPVVDAPIGAPLTDLTRPSDLDPDPAVVEIDLVAQVGTVEYQPGVSTEAWTYNGTVPGPLIDANVGDRLVVHFRNELPEPTTIHWHGVRVPVEMDGMPAMETTVASGGTFEYAFELPDAGLFWFHPHVRSDEQVERGLYGAILVRGAAEPELPADRVLMLDDVLVDPDGTLSDFDYEGDSAMTGPAMVGRQGNLVLVNGKARPSVTFQRGESQRWRLVNAANARFFRLSLPGHRLTLLGVDGGLVPAPREVEELMLVPGERADLLVTATHDVDGEAELVGLPYDRGHGTASVPKSNVLHVSDRTAETHDEVTVPETLREIEPLGAPVRTRTLVLSEDMGGGEHAAHGGSMEPVFMINDEVFPDITPLATELDAVEEWEIVNDSEMDHPFHLHGFFFQVLDGGTPAWKDTVNVPGKSTVRLAIRFTDHPGRWMYHCHILEHAERGMIGEVDVVAPEGEAPPPPGDNPHAGH